MRRGPLASIVVFALAAPTVVRAADPVSAHLTYAPAPGVEGCPTARELEDAVAARLGYDPFTVSAPPSGPIDVVVTVQKKTERVAARLVLGGPHGGEREIASSECREAVDAVAVAIAIGIDPASLAPPPPPEPIAPPAPPPATLSPPPAPAEAPPRTHAALRGRLMGGVSGFFGELPASAPGLSLAAALRYRWFEPTLEGFASFAGSRDATEGQVSASIAGAVIAPCVHVDPLFGCATLTVGNFHGEGRNLAVAQQADELYAAVGARLGAELRFGTSFFARLSGELDAPTSTITLQVDGRDAWTSPHVAARIGLAIGLETFE